MHFFCKWSIWSKPTDTDIACYKAQFRSRLTCGKVQRRLVGTHGVTAASSYGWASASTINELLQKVAGKEQKDNPQGAP